MNITTDAMAKYLGAPVSVMLADSPFRNWRFSRSVEKDLERIYYTCEEAEIDLSCDPDERLRTIFITYQRFGIFREGLSDLSTYSNRNKVREILGVPQKSGGSVADPILGNFGPWDRFSDGDCSIHIEYDSEAERISRVTFMRVDVAP